MFETKSTYIGTKRWPRSVRIRTEYITHGSFLVCQTFTTYDTVILLFLFAKKHTQCFIEDTLLQTGVCLQLRFSVLRKRMQDFGSCQFVVVLGNYMNTLLVVY